MKMKYLSWISPVFLIFISTVVEAYTPLLDEVEGLNGNNSHYLILPAWENLDAANKQKAYFIMPKYLVLSGSIDSSQPEYQFGVSHRGYTLFSNGTADYPPAIDLLATVQVFKDDKDIENIRKQLTDRDTAAGLMPPVFPDPVFEKFEGEAVVAGVASPTALANVNGGYPGQLTLVHVTTPPDALPSLVLDTPNSAGRQAALWGVVLKGTLPGYANRLKCQVSIYHKKVYEHFKARSSGQGWWGLVKADLAAETKRMDQNQSIDFGLCRGSADQIEKIVMPVWLKITELADQDGTKMFSDMIKDLNGIPGHPEASSYGWGFQASAGWEKVDYSDKTVINFDISYRTSWQLPLAMTFSTQCSKWKKYFNNNTNSASPCVSPNDFPAIRAKQRACYSSFLQDINGYPEDIRAGARKRLSAMGCAWDGSFSMTDVNFSATQTQADAESGRLCRKNFIDLASRWKSAAVITESDYADFLSSIGTYGCAWRGGPSLLRIQSKDATEELEKLNQDLFNKVDVIKKSF